MTLHQLPRGRAGSFHPAVVNYLDHVSGGRSLRAIARDQGIAPSTVLRRVRRVEDARDEPEIDQMLARLEKAFG